MGEPLTLFVPCFVDLLRPQAGVAAVRLLESLGHPVRVRPDVICCGQPFGNSGCERQAEDLARLWYGRMAAQGSVVVLSSSCTVHLRRARRAPQEGPQVQELCEFLDSRHPHRSFGRLQRTVCLHSACHGLRDSQADAHARALLERVEGLRVVRASRPDECCGFGGTFSTSFAALSVRMGQDRLDDIASTGAREVVATDLSCLIHLEGIALARGERLEFRHIGELLEEAASAPALASGGRSAATGGAPGSPASGGRAAAAGGAPGASGSGAGDAADGEGSGAPGEPSV